MADLIYTNIQHIPRKKWWLTLSEYVLCDMVYHLSNSPEYRRCIKTKRDMSEDIWISKTWLLKLIEKTISLWFIEKHPETKHIKTTQLWFDEFVTYSKQSWPEKQKETQVTKGQLCWPDLVNKVDQLGQQSWPNNNIYNNKDNNIDSKESNEQSSEIEIYWKEEINKMQEFIRKEVEYIWFVYKPWKQERNRIQNILTAKNYWDICEKAKMDRYEFTRAIIHISDKLDFWRWQITNAETLYKHYDKIFNQAIKLKQEHTKKSNRTITTY
jgi:hypothetical protein